jgi:hypothetical protein
MSPSVSDPVFAVLRNDHRDVVEALSYFLGGSIQLPTAFPPGRINRSRIDQE